LVVGSLLILSDEVLLTHGDKPTDPLLTKTSKMLDLGTLLERHAPCNSPIAHDAIKSNVTSGRRGWTRPMKSINRKVLMTLFGVVLATPFLLIASVVAVHVAALADNVRVDVLCIALALASVAVRIVDGHLALTGKVVLAERGSDEPKDNHDLRGASTISPGY
jgi:hypothetical protein